MNVMMLSWLWVEFKSLLFLYKIEIKKYSALGLMTYFKNLFYPKNKKLNIILISIVFFFFVFKFMIDVMKLVFRFYYMTINWFFNNLKFFLKFYTSNEYWLIFFSNIINFFQYIFLFGPVTKMYEKLIKTSKKLYVYIMERGIIYTVRFIWWKPSMSSSLAMFVDMTEFLTYQLFLFPSTFIIYLMFVPIIYLMEYIWNHFQTWYLYFGMLRHVRQYNKIAGVSYLRYGASLFHIAMMLQSQGFTAPKCEGFTKLKAVLEYSEYSSKYKKAELTPDVLDDAAIDMYVFLLELFSDTSYELKRLPMSEFFFILFPYKIFVELFWFLYYFYMGLAYFLVFLFFPVFLFYLWLTMMYELLKKLQVMHYLFFRDLDYLAKEKDKIWTEMSEEALKDKKKKDMYFITQSKKFLKKFEDILK